MRLTDKVSSGWVAVVLIAALLLTAYGARAGGNEHHQKPTPSPATSSSASSSASNANSNSSSSSSNNGGNVLEANHQDRLQAPSNNPPALYASGVCVRGFSAGLSIPGGSIGGGKAYPDPECDIREAARVLDGIGAHALALKVACTLAAVRAVALPEDCKLPPAIPTDPPRSPPVAPPSAPACDCTKAFEKAAAK